MVNNYSTVLIILLQPVYCIAALLGLAALLLTDY